MDYSQCGQEINSDKKTKILMPMQKALHSRDNVDRILRVKKGRKKRTRQDCVDKSIEGFVNKHTKKPQERLIEATINSNVNFEQTVKLPKTWKQKWKGKQLYIYFTYIMKRLPIHFLR